MAHLAAITSSRIAKAAFWVFLGQSVAVVAATSAEDTSWAWLTMFGLILAIIGAPVGYFLVFRKADFRASSRIVHLAAATSAGFVAGTAGLFILTPLSLLLLPH